MDKTISILYVEDDPMSRRVMGMILQKRLGIEDVVVFSDSQNFLERAEAISPAPTLIFLDIHVDPLDGFQMLKLIHQSEKLKHIPVIAMTASVMNEEIELLHNAGFDGCIGKPVNIELFPGLLQRILNGERIWSIFH